MSGWFKSSSNSPNPAGLGIIAYAGSTSSSDSDDEIVSAQVVPEQITELPPSSFSVPSITVQSTASPKSSDEITEYTPLLSQSNSSVGPPHQDDDERNLLLLGIHPEFYGSNKSNSPGSVHSKSFSDVEGLSAFGEFLVLIKSAVPVILAYTLQASLEATSILVVGRISPAALSLAAFCYMFAHSTAFIVALGGSTALDTLASSAYTGAKDRTDLGVLLQRAFVVLGGLYLLIAGTWWFAGPIFEFLGQEEHIIKGGPGFLRLLIPGGLGYVYFESVKKYLQAQGIMRAGTYVLMITAPLNLILNYLFVYTFDFGITGAPIATSISYWLSFFLLCLYAQNIAGYESWGGWSLTCFKNMFTFLRLAVLGAVMVGTEWWAFEIVAIVAGRLGTIPLAAQSVIMTTDAVINTIPFGIGVATSVRVGNLLGASDARGAARAANVAAWMSISIGVVILAVLMATKEVYARVFSDDSRVIELVAEVMPYVALFQVADGLAGSCGGSLRGMGRQHIGATVNILAYYCFALPLGIWLAYHGWGLAGLWVGQCLALYGVGIGEWALVYLSNWDAQVANALDRLDDSERSELGESRVI